MSCKVKNDLALAYRLIALMGWDDLTYTHLSARVPGKDAFYMYRFGLLFKEVQPENLLEVTFDGQVIEGQELIPNPTGYVMHSVIYQHRPDIQAIFHLHTPAGVAVASTQNGLKPYTQWALHFYQKIGYLPYHSLALSKQDHSASLAAALANYYVMMLENHGTVTCGKTIQEAFFYTHHLEKACQAQCLMGKQKPLKIPHDICQKTVADLLSFEPSLGQRDWSALVRAYQDQLD